MVVNSSYFKILKSVRFCYFYAAVSRVYILQVGRSHYCQHLDLFLEFFETLK
jgi:hypothetical protein